MSLTINFDQVSALNRNFHIPKLQDNFFFGNALLQRWKSRVKKRDLGKIIIAPLRNAAEGGGGDWYSGTDQHDTTIRNSIVAANFFPHNSIVPISIDEGEELDATTPDKVLDMMEEKMDGAEETARLLLTYGLFNAATNPKAITGLQFALPFGTQAGVAASTSYIGAQTYGGISCGGSAIASDAAGYWQPNIDTNSGAGYTTGSGGAFMQAVDNPISKMYAKIGIRCGKKPSLIVSNEGSWTDYHNSLVKNERYERAQRNVELARSGFDTLMYRNATWLTDPACYRTAAGVEAVYLIDENALDLYWDPRRNFYMEPWRKPHNQSTRVAYIKNRLELIFRERRSSGVILVNAAL